MPFEFSREAKNLDKTVENLIFFTLAIVGGREVVRENKTKQNKSHQVVFAGDQA